VCRCPESERPESERRWRVALRHGSASAFNGYRWAPSDFSEVQCLRCYAIWRTRAAYVERLPDYDLDEAQRVEEEARRAYEVEVVW
jgi:hypothetical protein